MMKKLFYSIILIVLLVAVLSINTMAADSSGQCGDNVRYSYVESSKTLTISGTGPMYDYAFDPPFLYTTPQVINISSGVTHVGATSFYYFDSVTQVILPDTLESIGENAFRDCLSLTSINFPSSLKSVGESAFQSAEHLKTVTIPATLTDLGKFAFQYCYGLESVEFEDGVTSIPDGVFGGCNALSKVTIPSSVKAIGEMAFKYCDALSEIVLPEGVTSIGNEAFSHCTHLESLFIPDHLTQIGTSVFAADPSLTLQCNCTNDCFKAYAESNSLALSLLHVFSNEWTVDKTPTSTQNGSKSHHCINCTAVTDVTELPRIANPFIDVKDADYFFAPVIWAAENQITTGTSANTFSPNANCTRGQIVTFLWRVAGRPEPNAEINPFIDVSSKDYCYKAVLWAVENGITNGTSPTTFSPNAPCTRGHAVTFLWRYAGSLDAAADISMFQDVQKSAYYAKAVTWAVENNITNGISSTAFGPNSKCTRGQIVSFLYRMNSN